MVDAEDEVRLLIPAEPGFLRLARLTAAAVGSRMGFTFDEVEDLRIAVDELCYFLLDGHDSAGTITLRCSIRQDALEVEGVAVWPSEGGGAQEELPEMSRRILEAVVDEFGCAPSEPRFWLRKRRAAG